MRNVFQFAIGFFKFDRSYPKLRDEIGNPHVVHLRRRCSPVDFGTISHLLSQPSGITDCWQLELPVPTLTRFNCFGKFNIRLHCLSVKAVLLF